MTKESRPLRVLITAGGTKVRIDDVRHLGNFAKGGFGTQLGSAFAARGAEVTLLGSEECLERIHHRGQEDQFHRLVSFKFYDELHHRLFGLIRDMQPDIVLMSAAVSDWLCANPHVGKITSDQERMSIEFVRAPKIIKELRAACGIKTFLVGFKLLSRAPRHELIEKAQAQVRDNRLNLTIANDLSKIGSTWHPVDLVTPEGAAIPLSGERADVAVQIVDFILQRFAVAWSKSVQVTERHAFHHAHPFYFDFDEDMQKLRMLLRFTKEVNVFSGASGNISWRDRHSDRFYISPRKVDKRTVQVDDMVRVSYKADVHQVHYEGEAKPSIDTCVHGALYKFLWGGSNKGFLHFHEGFVVPDLQTRFAYPCGTREEAEEIIAQIRRASTQSEDEPTAYRWKSFVVELVHHGYLMALSKEDPERLLREWSALLHAYRRHLYVVGHGEIYNSLTFYPVFASASIVGLVARTKQGDVSVYLSKAARGKGVGDVVLRELDRRGWTVRTDPKCAVVDYYVARGWKVAPHENGCIHLIPPSLRRDMQDAVTVCMVCPKEMTILLGKRKTKTWNGLWAFIGGVVDPGEEEQPALTAAREAEEEVKMQPFPSEDQLVTQTFATVGTNNGKRAYRVKTLVYFVEQMPKVSETEEMEPRVFSFEEALSLPMGPGTKYVLSKALALCQ
jgi:8-oxo-dGTP pyrophosphatase MutT (NUDIX family)/GNAT superfamily N-acetyltransferase